MQSYRYFYPRIPVENRTCKLCESNEVEDEFNFIMKCEIYSSHRTTLLAELGAIFNLDSMGDNYIFLLIMCASDYDIIRVVVRNILAAFEKRSTFCT